MIDELKIAADKWFGDNGHDGQELSFVLGFIDASVLHDTPECGEGNFPEDYRAGWNAGKEYLK